MTDGEGRTRAPTTGPPPPAQGPVAKHWRKALTVVGVVAIALMVRKLGPSTIARTIVDGGAFVPLIMALEAAWMGMDVLVLRALLGDHAKDAPWSAYVRSAFTAYAVCILLPAGRASAEVARAAMLSPQLGSARVTIGALGLQGTSHVATALISAFIAVLAVDHLGPRSGLALLLAASSLVMAALGALFLLGARVPQLWAFLAKHFKSLPSLASATQPPSSRPLAAFGWSVLGRLIQGVLFTTAVYAASGIGSIRTGFLAQGVSLVGSTFGDVVPQQTGVTEAAFFYFAGDLGLAKAPAMAVSIALLLRMSQLLLAGLCLLLGALAKGRPPAAPALAAIAGEGDGDRDDNARPRVLR